MPRKAQKYLPSVESASPPPSAGTTGASSRSARCYDLFTLRPVNGPSEHLGTHEEAELALTKRSSKRSRATAVITLLAITSTLWIPQSASARASSDPDPDPGIITIVDEPGVVHVTIPDPALKDLKGPVLVEGPEPGDTPEGDPGPGQPQTPAEPPVYDPGYEPESAPPPAAPLAGAPYQTLSSYVGNNSASHCSIYSPPCKFNIHKSASRTITPPGGKSGLLKSNGTALVDVYTAAGCCFTKADYYNTTSYSQWGGTSPWYATSIRHTDVWDIDYFGVTWTFGGSPSGTVSHGNGRISYANTVSKTWRVNHQVQHVYVRVKGTGRVTKVKYEVHGSYGFGSNFYTTDAYSSVALP